MLILPYYQFHIVTGLAPEEAAERLREVIGHPRWSRFLPHSKPYEGEVVGYHFRVWRIIHYRNNFNPIIEGSISATLRGTCVTIQIRLPTSVAVCYSLLLFGSCVFGIAYLV